MRWKVDPPGFRFDPRKSVARFSVIVPGTNAMRRRKETVYVERRDEALALWREFRDGVLRGETPAKRVSTFSEYVNRYLSDYVLRVSPSTAKSYRQITRNHLLPFFGARRLDEITMALVRDFVGSLKRYRSNAKSRRGKPLSPASINDYLAVLRLLVRDAHERGLLLTLPWRGKWPREKEEPLKLELSPEEHTRFLAVFDDEAGFRSHVERTRSKGLLVASPRFGGRPRSFGGGRRSKGEAAGAHFARFRSAKPLFVVALETGLRRSDLLALSWRSVDLDQGWIRLTMKKTKREATVPISAACRAALKELLARPVVAERVFVNGSGHPISWTTVQHCFDLAKELSGIIRRFRFHDLRHTFACTLASGGVSLQVISRALGHASVRMCERYARPSEEALLEIRRVLDAQQKIAPPVGRQGAL